MGIRKEEEEDAIGKEWSRGSSDKRQLNRRIRLSSLSQSRGINAAARPSMDSTNPD